MVAEDHMLVASRALRKTGGFTLIELLVTVSVLAILTALAAPSFANLINSNRLAGAANDVVVALQLARMEAIRRGESIVVCPSADGTTCSGNNWSRLVVRPTGTPGAVIRDVVLGNSGLSIKPSGNVQSQNAIRFSPDGFAWVGSHRQGALSVCSTRLPTAANTRDIRVAVSRVSVSKRNGGGNCSRPEDEKPWKK